MGDNIFVGFPIQSVIRKSPSPTSPRVPAALIKIRHGYFDIWWIVVVASVPTPDTRNAIPPCALASDNGAGFRSLSTLTEGVCSGSRMRPPPCRNKARDRRGRNPSNARASTVPGLTQSTCRAGATSWHHNSHSTARKGLSLQSGAAPG